MHKTVTTAPPLNVANNKEFLSKPVKLKGSAHPILKRENQEIQEYEAFYKDEFVITKKQFSQQFSQLYFKRLESTRQLLSNKVKSSKLKTRMVNKVLDIVSNEEVIVCGTLYKDMKLKPNILLEFTKDRFVEGSNIPTFATSLHRVRDDDILILEDEYGRVRLTFIDPKAADQDAEKKQHIEKVSKLVTGMVVACRCIELDNGDILINQVIKPGLQVQKPLSLLGSDIYVALVSGISIGHSKYSPLNAQLLVDYLTGLTGNSAEQNFLASVVRCIVVGNSVAAPEQNADIFDVRGSLRPRQTASLVQPMKMADALFSQIANTMHVDIMPGDNDPSNCSLPQQPIYRILLPISSKYDSVHLVTNPHHFAVHGTHFLGTSGQNLTEMRQYTTYTTGVNMLEALLEAGHLAPTAPDTLDCYPFTDRDPFIIKETPHVFFAGNQPQYESKLMEKEGKKVLLLSLPAFVTDPLLVLVNLRTLNAHPISFGVTL